MTHTVLVPSSLVREAESKRDATQKVGQIARAATVYRVDRLVVYPDREGERGRFEDGFVATVLRYAATPPYLRKEAWGVRDELEYAGVLPPLCVSSQTGSGPERPGSLTQGIVTEVGPEDRVRVTCGMQHPISLHAPGTALSEGERVVIRVSSREPVRARIVDEPPPGPTVREQDLSAALGAADAGLRIAASRHGSSLTAGHLASLPGPDGDFTVAFGAPERGLPAILDLSVEAVSAGESTGGFDRWLNTVPNQGSEVVRTEEAVFATLSPLTLPQEEK
ncbi:MAG: putative RNA uridine N3 methyltransferase [Haloferacaceae archaeon]